MRISDWSSDVCSSDLDLLSIIRDGEAALARIADHAASATAQPLSSVRLLAPIERPGKYLAIGMNYRKHVEEGAKLGLAEPGKQLWRSEERRVGKECVSTCRFR